MDTAFRKIDIDKYDEDVLLEEELYEPDPRDPAQVLADTRAKATTVRSFLAKYVSNRTLDVRRGSRILASYLSGET